MSLISPVSGQKWPWKTLVTILIAAWLNCAVLVMTGGATHGPSVSPDRPKATVPTWPTVRPQVGPPSPPTYIFQFSGAPTAPVATPGRDVRNGVSG